MSRVPAGRAPGAARAVALTVLAGAAVVATAAPAAAANTLHSDAAGKTLTSAAKVSVSATASRPHGNLVLGLVAPTGAGLRLDSATPFGRSGNALRDTLSGSQDLGCVTGSGDSCVPGMNGTWQMRLDDDADPKRPLMATFTLAAPPAAPTKTAATALDQRSVDVSWAPGREPDLTGYTVYDGSSVVADGLATDCGHVCHRTVGYDLAGAAGTHSFTVVAHRSTAPGSSDTLASSPGPAAVVTLAGAAQRGGAAGASGAPGSATGGPTPVGSTGKASAGPSASGKASKAAGGGTARLAPLGTVALPALPGEPSPSVAPDGGYSRTLGYKPQTETEHVSSSGPVSAISGALGDNRLASSMAAGLLLLLAGAHLRRWTRSSGRL